MSVSNRCGQFERACVAIIFLAIPIQGMPQATNLVDHWDSLRLLEGHWRGEVSGILGRGTGVRQYEFLYDDRYLVTRHASVRLPQEESPMGDHHLEFTVFSYDRERETIVLREFNVEGFVLEYDCEIDAQRMVCSSTRVESGEGMRARLTLTIKDRFQFEEVFELAGPGEDLSYYLTVQWTREPDLSN